uniref:glucuronosyltransferase n=1 Tax=Neogobius melanostomus TaxID=47308 RepID=A0A8C6SQZ9_9GOBI
QEVFDSLAEDMVISAGNVSTSSAPFTGKLLVIPMDGSHWVGVKAIAEEMGRRGHQVTVVMPEISKRLGPGRHYRTITYPVPYDKAFLDSVMSMKDVMNKDTRPFLEKMSKKFTQIQMGSGLIHTTAESLLFNHSLITHLQQQGFDAVLTDPMIPTGSIVARKLGLPTVNLLRRIPCSLDLVSAGCPSPSSYVPRYFTGYTDKMSFKQRVINNIVSQTFKHSITYTIQWFSNLFCGDVGVAEVLADSDIWLLRIDLTFEFPRPLMPNMVLVGGINCKVRNPLPDVSILNVSGNTLNMTTVYKIMLLVSLFTHFVIRANLCLKLPEAGNKEGEELTLIDIILMTPSPHSSTFDIIQCLSKVLIHLELLHIFFTESSHTSNRQL